MEIKHVPVLAEILAEQIRLPQDGVMVDATFGQGGHSCLFGQNLGSEGVIVGLDVDKNLIQGAHTKFNQLACRKILIQANFAQIAEVLENQDIAAVDFVLADLGVCSSQLAETETGLSFQSNIPLDMRLDKSLRITAADIVNKTDERSLANLIYELGQDKASRRIARFIVQYRQKQAIATTGQLAAIVCKALGQPAQHRKSKIHPATRTFQALRIAVNNELENLKKLLEAAPDLLKKGGYIAIISFHSLEDRLIKINFKENEKRGFYKIITKKPIVPDKQEINSNPRARSAKLRIAQKQ